MAKRTREEVRKNMQAIRSQNTKIEIMVGKALWRKGYRYRKNNRKIIGTPDFTFAKYKLAIFCDSIFWHGKNWNITNKRITTNREFWVKKIERNIERDKKVNWILQKHGWVVLRFWEDEIEKNILSVIAQIETAIFLLRKSDDEHKKTRMLYRKISQDLALNKFPRYTNDEEQVLSTPHLYE